jgi:hypothetical protein
LNPNGNSWLNADTGNVSIGTTEAGTNKLKVQGTAEVTNDLTVTGNLAKIKNVPYTWPSGQGGASTYLKNNGSGTLTWEAAAGGTTPSLDAVLAQGNITAKGATIGGLATIEANTGNISTAGKITATGTVDAASYNIAGSKVMAVLPGTRSLGVGVDAGKSHTTGTDNCFVGYQAGYTDTYGSQNTFLGSSAGYFSLSGNNNIFVGWKAGYNNTMGASNTFVGSYAGLNNITGDNNIFLGSAGYGNSSGLRNIYIGNLVSYANNGSDNTVLGNEAGYGSGGYFKNTTLVGYQAGYNLGGSINKGDNNILLGYKAGYSLTTGKNNIVIGYNIDAPSATTDNQLSIGNIIFATGVDGTGTTVSTGKVSIGTAESRQKLSVYGTIETYGTGGIKFPTGTQTIPYTGSSGTPSLDAVLAQGGTSTRDANVGKLTVGNTAGKITTIEASTGNFIGQTIRTKGGDTAPTTPTGSQAVAMGRGTTASGAGSTAMGYGANAAGNFSTAMGYGTNANWTASTAMGERTAANGQASTAMGSDTTANGDQSVAMGNYFTNSTPCSLGIGYNSLDILLNPNGNSWLNADTGNVGIGTTEAGANKLKVQGTAEVTGDLTVRQGITLGGDYKTSWPAGVSGGGISTTEADTFYVNVSGDAMTGTLTLETGANLIVKTGNVGIGTTTPEATLDVNGTAKISKVLTATKNATGALTTADFGKTITVTSGSDVKITLPDIGAGDIGGAFTIVKLGAGIVTAEAAGGDYIADSAAGGGINNTSATETFANITIQVAADGKWIVVGGHGTWATY